MIRFRERPRPTPTASSACAIVTFHIPKGQFVFLTGHSGAGKSSILSLIIGEQKPTDRAT